MSHVVTTTACCEIACYGKVFERVNRAGLRYGFFRSRWLQRPLKLWKGTKKINKAQGRGKGKGTGKGTSSSGAIEIDSIE